MSDVEVQVTTKKTTRAPAHPAETDTRRPALIIKYCRGRLGGSALLLTIVQRALAGGRGLIVIDGDEASKTMRTYYPAGGPLAALVPDGSDVAALKELLLTQTALMASDLKSRLVDVSGGSRDLDDILTELDLPGFCQDYGIDLLVIAMLGENPEDFEHVNKALNAGFVRPENLLLVFNYGVLGKKNREIAFKPIKEDPRFQVLIGEGARVLHMPNLPVMDKMREAKADVYATAASARMPDGSFQPIWQNMSKRWLTEIEQEFSDAGIGELLP